MESTDVEFVWSSLKKLISEAIFRFTPVVKSKKHLQPKWYNSSIRHQINKLRSFRKYSQHKPTSDNFNELSTKEAQLHADILRAKSEFESDLVNSLAFKHDYQLFGYIKSLSNRPKLPEQMYYGREKTSDNLQKPICFFRSVFSDCGDTLLTNIRMAKTTKWLNAILHYMKKVKSSISIVSAWPSFLIIELVCSIYGRLLRPKGGALLLL